MKRQDEAINREINIYDPWTNNFENLHSNMFWRDLNLAQLYCSINSGVRKFL